MARASKGFMREYQRARTAEKMRVGPLPAGVTGGATWGQKRSVRQAPHGAVQAQCHLPAVFGARDVGVPPARTRAEEEQAKPRVDINSRQETEREKKMGGRQKSA